MYASLVGAGVSKLYDLLQSATSSGPSAGGSSFSVPSEASGASGAASARSSGALSTDLNQLFIDLQASQGATGSAGAGVAGAGVAGAAVAGGGTGSAGSVANDLQSVFGDLKAGGGGHGHHRHHEAADAGAAGGPGGSATSADNPFQTLAASLTAYSKSQGLGARVGAASATSLSA